MLFIIFAANEQGGMYQNRFMEWAFFTPKQKNVD